MKRKIIITGATGLIGTSLCKVLKDNYEVFVFTRDTAKGASELPFINNFVSWDYKNPSGWMNQVDGAYAVIHLAGANLSGKRWSDDYKKVILSSREVSTRNLVHAIAEVRSKPEVFISASGVSIYGDGRNNILSEESPAGNDFLADVCKAWEYEAAKVEECGVRRVSVRTGVVLDKKEGALNKMLLPYKLFIGGPLGPGDQWFSWIHLQDIIRVYLYVLENNISGAVNGTSPNPVTMNEFAKELGKTLSRPSFFKVPELILRIVVGESASLINGSIRAVPGKLKDNGFVFNYPNLKEALEDTLK